MLPTELQTWLESHHSNAGMFLENCQAVLMSQFGLGKWATLKQGLSGGKDAISACMTLLRLLGFVSWRTWKPEGKRGSAPIYFKRQVLPAVAEDRELLALYIQVLFKMFKVRRESYNKNASAIEPGCQDVPKDFDVQVMTVESLTEHSKRWERACTAQPQPRALPPSPLRRKGANDELSIPAAPSQQVVPAEPSASPLAASKPGPAGKSKRAKDNAGPLEVDGAKVDEHRQIFKWVLCNTTKSTIGGNYMKLQLKAVRDNPDIYNLVVNTFTGMGLAVDASSTNAGRGGGLGSFHLRRPSSQADFDTVVESLMQWFEIKDKEADKLRDKLKVLEVLPDFSTDVFNLVMQAVQSGGTYAEGAKRLRLDTDIDADGSTGMAQPKPDS